MMLDGHRVHLPHLEGEALIRVEGQHLAVARENSFSRFSLERSTVLVPMNDHESTIAIWSKKRQLSAKIATTRLRYNSPQFTVFSQNLLT